MKFPKLQRGICLLLLFLAVFSLGTGLGCLSNSLSSSEDRKFQKYTDTIFKKEIASNSLNLHYTLAHPENYDIVRSTLSLGEISLEDTASYSALENYEKGLRQYDYEQLSPKHQITLDTLLLYFHTLKEGSSYELLEEVLSPGLGIQAQLPVLLAEYNFYDRDDIEDYLALLSQTDTYFDSILDFEKAKSAAGTFMRDDTLERILAQCRDFIQDPQNNYLIEIFHDKLEDFSDLKEEEKKVYMNQQKEILEKHVIPAYEKLIIGLEALKGTGENENGLCYFPDGRDYYEYLLKTQVGVYSSPSTIARRLQTQLTDDYQELSQLIRENPALTASISNSGFTIESPQKALEELSQSCKKDFPTLESTDYQVKYVHESLAKYLSPAFYLTPPLDTMSPNTIYINPSDSTGDLELFTTLAHEGFPGHLYQTIYFSRENPDMIRYLPSFGGYVEGWATYIESYAYSYADADPKLTRLLWLNRSINLCLYSLVDVGIHYYGWTLPDVTHYLGNFGIRDPLIVEEIFLSILENPVNYLRYYVGYLNFLDLKNELQILQGENFDLKDFHRQILEIGPVQFPVLQKHLGITPS